MSTDNEVFSAKETGDLK